MEELVVPDCLSTPIREQRSPRIAAVIPTYRASATIVDLLSRFGPEVDWIIVVDDACPESSGALAAASAESDPRLHVIRCEENGGVGAATMRGYCRALELGADICVKVDSDGQMAPEFIPTLVAPVAAGLADYSKGNRFHRIEDVRGMPPLRIVGNAGLSFLSKVSTGYWDIFDPTNGFTAIHAAALSELPFEKIDSRFFFESDLLFRLHLAEAVVEDVPMQAVYGDESSNLSEAQALAKFSWGHLRNFVKRVFYEYFLRDFNVASLEIIAGGLLLLFGVLYGSVSYVHSQLQGTATAAGTVGLVVLSVVVGIMMLQGFLAFDYARIPKRALQKRKATATGASAGGAPGTEDVRP